MSTRDYSPSYTEHMVRLLDRFAQSYLAGDLAGMVSAFNIVCASIPADFQPEVRKIQLALGSDFQTVQNRAFQMDMTTHADEDDFTRSGRLERLLEARTKLQEILDKTGMLLNQYDYMGATIPRPTE